MIQPDPKFAGKRVLIVEDEMLVAFVIEEMLTDLGCLVLGPYNTVATALRAALMEGFDLALLDVKSCRRKSLSGRRRAGGAAYPFPVPVR